MDEMPSGLYGFRGAHPYSLMRKQPGMRVVEAKRFRGSVGFQANNSKRLDEGAETCAWTRAVPCSTRTKTRRGETFFFMKGVSWAIRASQRSRFLHKRRRHFSNRVRKTAPQGKSTSWHGQRHCITSQDLVRWTGSSKGRRCRRYHQPWTRSWDSIFLRRSY